MPVPDYREIELTINRQIVVDQIAAFLYATGIVHDNEHVVDIDFTSVPMTLKLKKHQELTITKF